MVVTAEGSVAVAQEKLAALVALTETLRAGRTQADTLTYSVDWGFRRVDIGEREPERPFAVVDVTGRHSYQLVAGGFQNHLRPSGALWLWLELDWPPEYLNDPLNARRYAATWFGQVIDELAELAGRDVSAEVGPFSDGSGDLAIISIEQQIMAEVDEDETPEGEWYFVAGYTVEWGDG